MLSVSCYLCKGEPKQEKTLPECEFRFKALAESDGR